MGAVGVVAPLEGGVFPSAGSVSGCCKPLLSCGELGVNCNIGDFARGDSKPEVESTGEFRTGCVLPKDVRFRQSGSD